MRIRGRSKVFATLTVLLLGAGAASGCPLCGTETAEEVRAGLFDHRFVSNLAATLAPFPVFLSLVMAVQFDWPGRVGRRFSRGARQ